MLLGTWFVQVVTVMVMVMVMVKVMVMVTMVVLMKTTTALTVLTGRSRRLHPNAARGQHIIHKALTCNKMYIIHLQQNVYNTLATKCILYTCNKMYIIHLQQHIIHKALSCRSMTQHQAIQTSQ